MKIGIVTTWFERGAAYVSRQFRDALSPKHDVCIYARGGEFAAKNDPNWDDSSVTWGRRTCSKIHTFVDMPDFKSWLGKTRPEIVFFNEQMWWPPVLACQDRGIITGAYVDYYRERDVALFANFDFLVCNTRRHHGVFDWHPGCSFVPWGTNTNLFKPTACTPGAVGKVTFFHSAGMSPARKGTDLLIRAFSQLSGPSKLIIHSQVQLKEKLQDLAESITRLQNEGRLEVREETVTAPGLYHLGDVYVYPARLDGIGLTVAEAMACGLPVLVTNSQPMTEFLGGEGTGQAIKVDKCIARSDGYYWPQNIVDIGDLRDKLSWYEVNLDRLPEMKRLARAHAEQHLDWRTNAEALPKVFEAATLLRGAVRINARAQAEKIERMRVDIWETHPLLTSLLRPCLRRIKPFFYRRVIAH